MVSSSTVLFQPYVAMHLAHFPVNSFITPSGFEIHPAWSGEGNLSYWIINPKSRKALLIDPNLEILGSYLLTLDMQQYTLEGVIDTHTHAEHASAAPTLYRLFDIPYLMNHRAPSTFVTDRM